MNRNPHASFLAHLRRVVIGLGILLPVIAPAQQLAIASTKQIPLNDLPAALPKWSPDGKWISCSGPKGVGIYLLRADGSEAHWLTQENGAGYRFAWSPDGAKIAFRSIPKQAGARNYVVRIIDVETGEIESSTETLADAEPPVWQCGPGGMRTVIDSPGSLLEGNWQPCRSSLHLPSMAGPPVLVRKNRAYFLHAGMRQISAEAALRPAWSPDGKCVLFDSQDTLSLSSADGTIQQRSICVGQHPSWSPDCQWLVFQLTRDHSHTTDDARQHTPDSLPHVHSDKTNHQIVDSDLWIIHPDGTGRQQLTNTPDVLEVDPDWSPDGTRILCRVEGGSELRILTLSAAP
jgi:Tol biopolymer transport system component